MVTPIGAMRDAADGGVGPGRGPWRWRGWASDAGGDPGPAVGLDRAAARCSRRCSATAGHPLPGPGVRTLPAGDDPPYPRARLRHQRAAARGDVTIGAVGTLTAIDGARVLAFGHPLLGQGNVALPLAPA